MMEVFGGICYRHFVLSVLVVTYLLNQLDRYMLAVTIKPMAQELRFGDQSCQVNASFRAQADSVSCSFKNVTICQEFTTDWNATNICIWDYDGQGLQYQIVAGPVFTVFFTITGIVVGFAGDGLNRKNFLCCCLVFWSTATIMTGFINAYWQLVLLRLAVGIGEAGCTPLATSLIADYFPKARRGLALGIYNLGIYMGYSISFALGNFVTERNILGQGWRWSFIISGCPGILLSCVMVLSVKEPKENKPNSRPHLTSRSSYKKLSTSSEDSKVSDEIAQVSGNVYSHNPTSGRSILQKTEVETTSLVVSKRGCQKDSHNQGQHDKSDISLTDTYRHSRMKGREDVSRHGSETVNSPNIQEFSDENEVVYTEKDHIMRNSSPRLKDNVGCGFNRTRTKMLMLFRPFVVPSMIMLVVSGSIRNAAGYVWAYNTQPFFSAIGESPHDIGAYMSWIPMVGGSIGVVLGGFISDTFVKKRGAEARVLVVVVSQMLAVPFAVATLMAEPPSAYFFQIPTYIIGEMWLGVTLTVVIELVPYSSRTSAIALYLFISTNFAGVVPLIVPSLQTAFLDAGYTRAESFRGTLYILYPGMVTAGAILYILTLLVMRKYRVRDRSHSNMEIDVTATHQT